MPPVLEPAALASGAPARGGTGHAAVEAALVEPPLLAGEAEVGGEDRRGLHARMMDPPVKAPTGNHILQSPTGDPPRSEATRTGAPPGRGGSEDRARAAEQSERGPGRRAERGRYITSVLGRSQTGHNGSGDHWPDGQLGPPSGARTRYGTLSLWRDHHTSSLSTLSLLSLALSIPRAAARAGAPARACPCPWTPDHSRTVRTVEADHVGDI